MLSRACSRLLSSKALGLLGLCSHPGSGATLKREAGRTYHVTTAHLLRNCWSPHLSHGPFPHLLLQHSLAPRSPSSPPGAGFW